MAGGAEVYAYELYCGMRDHSAYEAFFLAHTKDAPHTGVPFRAIGDDPRQTLMATAGIDYFYGTLPDKLAYLKYFNDYLLQVKPDVVHFQHTLHLGFEMIRQVKNSLPEAVIVYTLHEFLPICHANGQMIRLDNGQRCMKASPARCHGCFPHISAARFFMRNRFINAQFDLVDHFHAPSLFLRDRYIDWGIPENRITQLEYGRHMRDPAPPRELNDGDARNRFGFFGQVSHYKGLHVLLRAVDILRQRDFTDFSVTINGANLEIQPDAFQKEFGDLLKRCGNLVNVAGPYQNEEVGNRIGSVDWVIIPSIWWENSPLVIQEGFMHKRPVIASNIGGMAEKVTDDVDGLHFQAGNPADLADVIQRAATDKELWDRLASGIKPVFDMSSAIEEHDRLYHRLTQLTHTEKTPSHTTDLKSEPAL